MEIGTVKFVDIDQEMRESYLSYAMSVIVARALPDARDGLKPVHRRILFAIHDMGLRHERPYKKSARIVGEVLGKYHPHGDMAVYESMVRMAQDFSMRYPLVDGQGNFGSLDGDSAAAMRYTEARLAEIAEEMLADIDKDTVDFIDNFDGSLKEPVILPARLPNLLLNGTSGIAVGMATNIPPHNLGEVCDGLIYLIDHYHGMDEIGSEDLLEFIKGPDFPTGGLIIGDEGIKNAYRTGKGQVVMRAKAHLEEMGGGRHRIVVTEVPYQVNKSALIERIAQLVRDKRIEAISDLRDESDRRGMSIVIELKRGATPKMVLNQLFKYTSMQSTFGVNMLALVDEEPRLLTLKRALQHYLEHRQEVVTRRTRHDLEKAKGRAHILEGFKVALDKIDAVIETIRKAKDAEVAKAHLMRRFKLTAIQTQAILDMQLRRLAALERQRIEDEYLKVIKDIAYFEDLLANPRKILHLIKEELAELKRKYADRRRTVILPQAQAEIDEEELVPHEETLISITQRGYIKRVLVAAYRSQLRGGRGVIGAGRRERDVVEHLFVADSHDSVLFFTNQGKVYQEKAYQMPDVTRQARGLPLINLISLSPKEMVTAALAVSDFGRGNYLVMATKNGRVKKTSIEEFAAVRPSGLIALGLVEGDELGWVKVTEGNQEVILVTERGLAIRFSEEEVRPMGREAAGVMGIKLAPGDAVAAMDVVDPQADLLVVTEKGYGKRVPLSEYLTHGRYGQGVSTLDKQKLDQTGKIVTARVVKEGDEVTLISAEGMVLRLRVKEIPSMGRATRGVKMMALKEGDVLASLARVNARGKGKG